MYTPEETQILLEKYTQNPTPETVEELARILNKPKKSIIGKLVKEKVYVRITYKTKLGEDPITKKELTHQIADKLNVPVEKIQGLEKSPKSALKTVLNCLS